MFATDSDTVAGAKKSFALNSQESNMENFDFGLLAPLGSL